MRMEQLRCLVDIAQTGSLTSTAQRLYMTQPAVSQRIKQLEQDLGVELLVRTKAGTELTAAGERIVAYAKQILELEDEMKLLCEQGAMEQTVPVEMNVCSASAVTDIVLPDIISKLGVQRKSLSIRIHQANTLDELIQQVEGKQCSFAMVTYNEEKLRDILTTHESLRLATLALDELVVVTDRKYIKEDKGYLSLTRYLNSITTQYGLLPTDEIREASMQKNPMSSNNADFHRRMIEKAGAIVAMPGLAYQYFFNAKRYAGLPLENMKVPLIHGAIYHSDADDQTQSVIAMIRKELMQNNKN